MDATIKIRKNLWLQTQFFCASSFPDAVPCARGDGRLWLPKWKGTTKLDDLSGDALCGCGDGRRWLPKREGTTKWEDLPAPQPQGAEHRSRIHRARSVTPRGTRRSSTKRHSTARKAHAAGYEASAARSATATGHEATARGAMTKKPAVFEDYRSFLCGEDEIRTRGTE